MAVVILAGAGVGAVVTLAVGTEHVVVIPNISTMDPTYGISGLDVPPPASIVAAGALVGAAVAGLLLGAVRKRLRKPER